MDMVKEKWKSWDRNQRGLLRRGFGLLSATDGKLDEEEFQAASAYLADLVSNVMTPVRVDVGLDHSRSNDDLPQQLDTRNRKRPRSDEDFQQQPETRNVRQRTVDV